MYLAVSGQILCEKHPSFLFEDPKCYFMQHWPNIALNCGTAFFHLLYGNDVLSCWQAVSCSLSSNCRQSLLPHVFMIDLWVRSQDAWLCHRGTLSWILYILPVHKEWNHDLAYFVFLGQDNEKIQTFFLIFRCRPQTLPPRNATQGKISSGSDFILEPCDSHSHGWLG